MRTTTAVMAVMLLGAAGAEAADIQGKWGIGAGVFNGRGEASLIRGKSERSAWLFDVAITQRDETAQRGGLFGQSSDQVLLDAGPGYRRFVRGTDALSPYWDVSLHGAYQRFHYNSGDSGSVLGSISETRTGAGGEAAFSFGLEYFTPWHFSVAAHSRVASFTWLHTTLRRSDSSGTLRASGHSEVATIGLAPAIYVRGYF